MIHEERIRKLNEKPARDGDYVLYWMQASQRAEYNHALEHAVRRANELDLPVITFFCVTGEFPDANERHYIFMLQGLGEVEPALRERNIRFVVRLGEPGREVARVASGAALLVTDRGYLRVQRKWRSEVAERVPCAMEEVESDVVVPVEEASSKEEYAAATIRPKITRLIERYMVPLRHKRPRRSSLSTKSKSLDLSDTDRVLERLGIDWSVGAVRSFTGGTKEAKRLLRSFISKMLYRYDDESNDPTLGVSSRLSPYLHFGQISPLYIALQVRKNDGPGAEAFLEQLIVRRELSMNFVYYNKAYDSYRCVPQWAKESLKKHSSDSRPYAYTFKELEEARTHDRYWNAAQDEMRLTGSMHNYMRMYWGKKIIEWTERPETAFRRALKLNNRYELDGRDPNGFAGVAWCFGKHDRGWKERPVFGKVRYMNDRGLERKFDIEKYVQMVKEIKSDARS